MLMCCDILRLSFMLYVKVLVTRQRHSLSKCACILHKCDDHLEIDIVFQGMYLVKLMNNFSKNVVVV